MTEKQLSKHFGKLLAEEIRNLDEGGLGSGRKINDIESKLEKHQNDAFHTVATHHGFQRAKEPASLGGGSNKYQWEHPAKRLKVTHHQNGAWGLYDSQHKTSHNGDTAKTLHDTLKKLGH